MRLIDADKLMPIDAPIAGIISGELTHYEKIVFWKTIYDAPTINVIDEVLEIIDKAAADYEAVPTEIDVGREKAVISFEKKDGMLAMASMIRVLVLGLRGEE